MRFWTLLAAVLAFAAFTAAPSSAQTARPFDVQQLTPEVRASVELARAAQTRALMAAARAQDPSVAGHVRFTGTGGDTYNGACSTCAGQDVQRHGYGILSWPDGEVYTGAHLQGGPGGYKHGHGVYIFVNGMIFEGEYSRDRYNGYGVLWAADGSVVEQGRFVDGQIVDQRE